MKSSTVKLEALDPGLLPQGRQVQDTVSFSHRDRKQLLWGTTAWASILHQKHRPHVTLSVKMKG